jgi:hypothetical protein
MRLHRSGGERQSVAEGVDDRVLRQPTRARKRGDGAEQAAGRWPEKADLCGRCNAERHRVRETADAYVRFMYEDEAQEIAAQHHFRPRNEAVAARHQGELPQLELFTIEEVATSWAAAQERHFGDGGLFDRISEGRPSETAPR